MFYTSSIFWLCSWPTLVSTVPRVTCGAAAVDPGALGGAAGARAPRPADGVQGALPRGRRAPQARRARHARRQPPRRAARPAAAHHLPGGRWRQT